MLCYYLNIQVQGQKVKVHSRLTENAIVVREDRRNRQPEMKSNVWQATIFRNTAGLMEILE